MVQGSIRKNVQYSVARHEKRLFSVQAEKKLEHGSR